MLNTFPQLLDYSFYAPTLIRVTVALAFAFIAYLQWRRHAELAHITLPIVGKAPWWVWTSVAIHIALATALLLGYYTQVAALLGVIISAKQFIFAKRYPRAVPLCRLEYLFLVIMCVSLLLTGAGALALDVRL